MPRLGSFSFESGPYIAKLGSYKRAGQLFETLELIYWLVSEKANGSGILMLYSNPSVVEKDLKHRAEENESFVRALGRNGLNGAGQPSAANQESIADERHMIRRCQWRRDSFKSAS